jgi:hypothetical protein
VKTGQLDVEAVADGGRIGEDDVDDGTDADAAADGETQ